MSAALFKRIWRGVSGEDEALDATSPDHRTREVLLAALPQGATFGVVKASIDRAGAKGYRKLTGEHLDD